VLRGINNINIDAKGRLAIPTRYRERLIERCQGNVVVTIDTEERCLLIYPLPDWEDVQRKLAPLPGFSPAVRRVRRLLIGHATDIELDGNGRLQLPPPLREYANLDKKAVLLGQGSKFELWNENHWHEQRESYLEIGKHEEDLPDELKNLSL